MRVVIRPCGFESRPRHIQTTFLVYRARKRLADPCKLVGGRSGGVTDLAYQPADPLRVRFLAGREAEVEPGEVARQMLAADVMVPPVDAALELGEVAVREP